MFKEVGYAVAGAPRCVLEAAASTGFKHVSPTVLDRCFKDLGLRQPSRAHMKASRLINHFKDKWGWTEVDVARGVRHVMPGAKVPQRHPAAEDVPGREVPDELLDLLGAMEAELPEEEAAGAAAAEPAVEDPELPGVGKVERSLFDALVNPHGPGSGTESIHLHTKSMNKSKLYKSNA